jgi:Dynein heavy chain, N-terminal region 1
VFCVLPVNSQIFSSDQASVINLQSRSDIRSKNSLSLDINGTGDASERVPVNSGAVQASDLYKVNFDPGILEMIGEVKYLERLGYKVPEMARNIAMLEDVYIVNVSELNQMLERYYDTLALLDDVQVITWRYFFVDKFMVTHIFASISVTLSYKSLSYCNLM